MAFKGAGSSLSVGNGASPEVFTAITEVVEFSGPDSSNEEIETTNLASTAKEFIPALKDQGTLDFTAHLDTSNAQHTQLDTDSLNGTTRNYRITWDESPQAYITFSAFLSSLSYQTDPNDTVKISGTLRITAAPTKNW